MSHLADLLNVYCEVTEHSESLYEVLLIGTWFADPKRVHSEDGVVLRALDYEARGMGASESEALTAAIAAVDCEHWSLRDSPANPQSFTIRRKRLDS